MIERVERVQPAEPHPASPLPGVPVSGPGFAGELRAALEARTGLRLSNHVQRRLESRQIDLTPETVHRLAGAVDRAEGKGARESLVLVDDVAWVVSIRNKTLITAVDAASRKENVFTNIDSVVIA